MRIVGYVSADGTVPCPEHAAQRGLEDEDNETGEAGAIFDLDAAESDLVCNVRHHDGCFVMVARNTEDE